MASIVTEPNTELNSGPRFTDADTKPPQDANPVSQSNGDDGGSTGMTDNGYPEQRHAGAVGYGPSYNQDVGIGEKIAGIKEQVKGKITKNPDLVEHGQLRRTGELQKREAEEKETDPFATAEGKAAEPKKLGKDIGAQHATTVAPEGTNPAAGQSQGQNIKDVKNID